MRFKEKSDYWDILLIAGGLLLLSALSLLVDVDLTRNRRSDFIAGDFRRIIQLSEIFAHGFGIVIALYLVWRLIPERRTWIPRLAACAILPGLLCQFIKLFVVRYRPNYFFPNYAEQVADTWVGVIPAGVLNFGYVTQSFPSAHAATAVGLAIGMIWVIPNCRNLFVTLAVLASIQRVVAGAHWMSDVFAGAAISFVVCGLVFRGKYSNWFFAKFEKTEDKFAKIVLHDSAVESEAKAA